MFNLTCHKCGFTIGCDDNEDGKYFYRKNKKRPIIGRSSYSGQCNICMKEYKKEHYKGHYKEIMIQRVKNRRNNPERWAAYLQRLKDKRVEKAKGMDIIKYTERSETRKMSKTLSATRYYLFRRLRQWKHSAKKRLLDFNLDFDYLCEMWDIQDGKCAYSGIPMSIESNSDVVVSLDRINPDLGYIKGNVVYCIDRINTMKWTSSLSMFKKLIDTIYIHLNNTDYINGAGI